MASAAKATTNLTRLAVAKNPHHVLGVLYSKSLRALAKMPSDYAYRKHTEQIITERAELTKATKVFMLNQLQLPISKIILKCRSRRKSCIMLSIDHFRMFWN